MALTGNYIDRLNNYLYILDTMNLWQPWILVVIILVILELFTPGFVLASIAMGCLLASLAAMLGLPVKIQIIYFAIGSLSAFIWVRPFFMKYIYSRSEQIKTNTDALSGRTALVIQDIDPAKGTGRVKLGGEDWKGVSANNASIRSGKLVTVIRVDGAKLIVRQNKTINR